LLRAGGRDAEEIGSRGNSGSSRCGFKWNTRFTLLLCSWQAKLHKETLESRGNQTNQGTNNAAISYIPTNKAINPKILKVLLL
jgi:hypothetical protein